MSESKQHKCDACGGTGDELEPFNGLPYACDVCLGAGTISDVMPARDAVADAETLRASIPAAVFPPKTGNDFRTANLLTFVPEWDRDYSQIVSFVAREDARAAFRAVPGLRG